MRFNSLFLLAFLAFFIVPALAENNDFYDDTETVNLAGPLTIEIGGELESPGRLDLSTLPLRSLMVREAVPEGGGSRFVGSYRYDGYSLFDILKPYVVKKKNAADFKSVIDLLVLVENAKGDKVILSWGEIFYPVALHRVIIATKVARIVPFLTKEQWPLPTETRLVCGEDLLTVRGISNPTRITVLSAPYPAFTGPKPQKLFCPDILVKSFDGKASTLKALPKTAERRVYPTVFYGRGKGFHGTQDFTGVLLKDVLRAMVPQNPDTLARGYLVVGAPDGYRIAITCSELFNRNDCKEFLIMDVGAGDGGRFTLFPACDYFSDRAVKSVKEIVFHP